MVVPLALYTTIFNAHDCKEKLLSLEGTVFPNGDPRQADRKSGFVCANISAADLAMELKPHENLRMTFGSFGGGSVWSESVSGCRKQFYSSKDFLMSKFLRKLC
jgi:hypothetical protein